MVTKCRLPRIAPDERREHIRAVAADVFAQKGYGATSMSMIAGALGGSKATLYKYYPSKEVLFEAVLQDRCGAVQAPLHNIVTAAGDSPEDLLFAFGMHFLRVILSEPSRELYRMVHSEGKQFPEAAMMFFRAGPERTCRALADAMAPHVAEGRIVLADPLLAMEQFVGMLMGTMQLRLAADPQAVPDEAEIARRISHAVRIFMKGIAR